MSEQATPQMAKPKHGEFCWNELGTSNLEICKPFYAEIFGWHFKENKSPEMIYNEMSLDGTKQFGGMFQMGKEFGDVPSHWMAYIAVDDVDASAAKVTELGGNVCVPPTDIPNTGRFCVVNDPSGATFSLITLKGQSDVTQKRILGGLYSLKNKCFFAGSARITACWTQSVQKVSPFIQLIWSEDFHAAKRDVARRDACAPSNNCIIFQNIYFLENKTD